MLLVMHEITIEQMSIMEMVGMVSVVLVVELEAEQKIVGLVVAKVMVVSFVDSITMLN